MIDIKHVSLRYSGQKDWALDNLNLTIKDGEFFGLLGPNGAGKTTLIKLLSTLLTPDQGEIYIDGEKLFRTNFELKKKLSMITQEYSLRANMNLLQIMELHGRLYGLSQKEIKEKSEELFSFVGLEGHTKKICRHLSGGMKRKLMLCRGLLTSPEILLLDEPTVGLDPFARRQMWDLLKQLNEKGITILLTTHYIDEAQYLCSDIALIDQGTTNCIDTPKNLINSLGAVAVDYFDGSKTESAFFDSHEQALDFAKNCKGEFMIRNTTLEDVFIAIVGKRLEVK